MTDSQDTNKQQQEPVATKLETQQFNCFHVSAEDFKKLATLPVGTKLYTSPPAQRKPLTDEQIIQIASTPDGSQATTKGYVIPFARAIEAAHGIKENT